MAQSQRVSVAATGYEVTVRTMMASAVMLATGLGVARTDIEGLSFPDNPGNNNVRTTHAGHANTRSQIVVDFGTGGAEAAGRFMAALLADNQAHPQRAAFQVGDVPSPVPAMAA